MWNTIRIFKTFFENQGILFIKMDKKGISKKCKTLQNEGFFCSKKWKRQEKLEMRKLTKKLQKPSQPEGRKNGTRKMCSSPNKKKRKTKQREQREKWWKKKEDEKTKSEKSKRKTQTRREKQEEKGREKDEKRRYTKEVFKKEAREMQKKTRLSTFFSKREKTFLHTKRFQLKIKAEKTFLVCFFKKKKERLIKRTFFLIFCDFCKNEEEENSWWNMRIDWRRGRVRKYIRFFFLWSTTKEKNKWEIQKNKVTKTCRKGTFCWEKKKHPPKKKLTKSWEIVLGDEKTEKRDFHSSTKVADSDKNTKRKVNEKGGKTR